MFDWTFLMTTILHQGIRLCLDYISKCIFILKHTPAMARFSDIWIGILLWIVRTSTVPYQIHTNKKPNTHTTRWWITCFEYGPLYQLWPPLLPRHPKHVQHHYLPLASSQIKQRMDQWWNHCVKEWHPCLPWIVRRYPRRRRTDVKLSTFWRWIIWVIILVLSRRCVLLIVIYVWKYFYWHGEIVET